jgi:hypothetical protein
LTFGGLPGEARDAEGSPIWGSPGRLNALGMHPTEFSDQSGPLALTNEIAWAGTAASPSDEWIELYNPGTGEVDLQGWLLTDRDDLNIQLNGTIAAGAYFLLERTDDETISNLPADQIYAGSLNDQAEILWLVDPAGEIVDTANAVRPGRPVSLLTRAVRQPSQIAWLRELKLLGCGAAY